MNPALLDAVVIGLLLTLPIHREMPLNPDALGNLAAENRSWLFLANYATKSGNFW